MTRILITGASRGIGRAIAERLAVTGREVLLQGRDAIALAETRRLVESRGARCRVLVGDLARPSEVRALADAVGPGPLHALVNNAGSAVVKPVEDISLDEWERGLAVGVTAPFLLTQALLSRLASGSSIVNLLSVAARRGFPRWSAYCAAKFALEGFSQSLREELRPRGVRVVNIYPAATDTALWNQVAGEWDRTRMIAPGEVAEAVAFVVDRPAGVLVESIEVGDLSGPI